MQIGSIGRAASIKTTELSQKPTVEIKKPTEPVRFADMLQGMMKNGDLQKDLARMEASIGRGKPLNTNDLMLLQIKAGQFHLNVELVTKVADGVLSATRRLQSGQQ